MSRFNYLTFNILLVLFLLLLIYLTGSKHDAINYTRSFFLVPYVFLNMLMSLILKIRSIVGDNADLVSEAFTFWHASWIVGLLSFIGIKFLGGHLTIAALMNFLSELAS